MENEESPRIEFPCRYPIKVMGLDENNFREAIIDIIRQYEPDLSDEDINFRPSRHGKYLAVNVIINAQGVEQIEKLFNDLKASGRVAMVL
jgi:putative lipoic acid-binding regulatory protein